jgi:hypothetical protein
MRKNISGRKRFSQLNYMFNTIKSQERSEYFGVFLTDGKCLKVGYTDRPIQKRVKELNTGSSEKFIF